MVSSPGEHPVPGITGSPWTQETGVGHWACGHRMDCLGLVPWLALCPSPGVGHPQSSELDRVRDSCGWVQAPHSSGLSGQELIHRGGRERITGALRHLVLPSTSLEGVSGLEEREKGKVRGFEDQEGKGEERNMRGEWRKKERRVGRKDWATGSRA